MDKIIRILAKILAAVFPYQTYQNWRYRKGAFRTYWLAPGFKSLGKGSLLKNGSTFVGREHISIGENTTVGYRTILAAHSAFPACNQTFTPELTIGSGVNIGDYSNITCINRIEIGDGVRMGRKVFITDNAHGVTDGSMLDISPIKRPLTSKGPVIIEENVWVGENAAIMPGVRIGKGAIVGANAVVTHDVPAYAVVGGNPARVIKQMR